MIILRAFRRPEYFFRPVQIWRRLRRKSLRRRDRVELAWGLPICIEPLSIVSFEIWNLGVFDPAVPEAICRLLDPGDRAIDVGANIGQNTSIMALAAGIEGAVDAFEPGPGTLETLEENVRRWSSYEMAPMRIIPKGVSSQSGTGKLHQVGDPGGATIENRDVYGNAHPQDHRVVKIGMATLDTFYPEDTFFGLMKIDVEGHETAVFEGANRLFESGRVRDVVFEDFQPKPSPLTDRFEDAGYRVFGLYPRWAGIRLIPLDLCEVKSGSRSLKMCNFLATRDADRARDRFRGFGWKCLSIRAHRSA